MMCLVSLYTRIIAYINRLQPAMLLVIRLMAAHVFWVSGILKLEDFSTTIELFTSEHPVPFLPPIVAAYMGTTFEVCCPILLALGLGARLAALPLIIMTAVINFTYQEATEHYFWAILLSTVVVFGPGKWSLDAWAGPKIAAAFTKRRMA